MRDVGVSKISGTLWGPYYKGVLLFGVSSRGQLFSQTPMFDNGWMLWALRQVSGSAALAGGGRGPDFTALLNKVGLRVFLLVLFLPHRMRNETGPEDLAGAIASMSVRRMTMVIDDSSA